MKKKSESEKYAYDGCLLWVIIIIIIALASCKTSKVITQTKIEYDSTAIHTAERLRKDSAAMVETHKKELETLKKSQVTLDCNCDTIIIMPGTNADSLVKIINALKTTIKYNKDGSYELTGKINSLITEKNKSLNELDSLAYFYTSLQKEFIDSTKELSKLREEKNLSSKSKPGGIFGALPWILVFITAIVFFIVGYKIKNPAKNNRV